MVVIVSNVVLWSYQMNQLDWERMREDISIANVARVEKSYNPSEYVTGGSTTWVSGGISNLTSDDGVSMAFRSYFTGTSTNIEDYVDNNTSDVDSSADKGTHSNFTAQQYGPDGIFDTLTEENIPIPESWVSPNNYLDPNSGWNDESNAYDGDTGTYAYSNALDRNADAELIYYNLTSTISSKLAYWVSNNVSKVTISITSDGNNWVQVHYTTSPTLNNWVNVTYTQTTVIALRILLRNTNTPNGVVRINELRVLNVDAIDNYELDLEVQWTNVDYGQENEELCIYAGNMGNENLRVDYWNGSSWINLIPNLTANGWNNVSVSLLSPTFTIRFKGTTETNDLTRDTWDIDALLLHAWSIDDQYTVEVEFTGTSNIEEWFQLVWTVDSAWTAGLVDVTLQLYNYTLGNYPTGGNGYIAYTSNDAPNTDETKNQTVTVNPTHFRNATSYWRMKVKGVKATDEQFDLKVDWVEFKAVIASGTLFTFKNEGSLTTHLVSLWVINSTHHQRYDIDVIINSGETLPYSRVDISLPAGEWIVKVVTERGNIAIFSE